MARLSFNLGYYQHEKCEHAHIFDCFLQVSSTGAAARDGRLQVGMRILEVNNHSLLGMTHTEAVRVLRAVGDSLVMLVCDGFDPGKVAAVEVR